MREKKQKKKKLNRIINLLLLLLLVLILLLLDGRFGLGGLLGTSSPDQTDTEAPAATEETPSSDRHRLRVSEDLIFLDNTSIEMTSLAEALQSLPEGAIIILVDDLANNSIFESVENLLKENEIPYTIEE